MSVWSEAQTTRGTARQRKMGTTSHVQNTNHRSGPLFASVFPMNVMSSDAVIGGWRRSSSGPHCVYFGHRLANVEDLCQSGGSPGGSG